MNVQPIHAIEKPVNQSLVECLEEVLARAKTGEVSSMVLLTVERDSIKHWFRGVDNRFLTAGHLFHLAHQLIHDRNDL